MLDRDPDDGSYTVTVPALPGIVTQGRDLEDAIAMGRDAIRCHINGLLKEGLPVPEESERPPAERARSAMLVTLDVDLAVQVAA